MINEVIDLSRSESTKSLNQSVRFKLKQLVDDVTTLIQPAIENKSLKLTIDYDDNIPKILIGERTHLYRVLLNLTANAIKFTKQGSIAIKVKLAKEIDQETIIKITIKDTGIGIPKDKQTTIFERFIRLSPSYEGIYQGSGLGLSIVKQFIEEMHGEIHVESQENKGSTFTFIIPFRKPLLQDDSLADDEDLSLLHETSIFTHRIVDLNATEQEKPVIVADNFKLPKNTHILLVEDNLIAAQAVKDTLQSLGCHVDVAYTGYDALSLFDVGKYNLIYMDLGLPDLGGREVTKEIRKIESHSGKNTPIIALSAHIDEELRLSCVESGMNDVFTKPLMRHQAIRVFSGTEKDGKSHQKLNKHTSSDKSKIIDLELGASITGANLEQAKEALTMFIKALPETKKKIDQTYHAKDMDELFKAVHKMHGSLSYCGAPKLKNTVMNLEIALKTQNLKHIDALYLDLCTDIEVFVEAYKNLENQP